MPGSSRKTFLFRGAHLLLVAVTALLLQGCFLFKKKCDCPSFGKRNAPKEISKPS